jgi:putative spermidine/putrescine transport system substrate-binding protein
MKEQRHNMSRREFLYYSGAAAAIGAVSAVGLGPVGKAHAAESFKIIGGAEDLIGPIIKEFEKTHGMKMETTLVTHAVLNNKMLTGGDRIYDACESCLSFMQVLSEADILRPIPVKDLKYFSQLRDWFVDEKAVGTDHTGWPASNIFYDEKKEFVKYAPQLWGYDTLAYNWEKVAPMPLTRMILFDEKYAGKTGIWNDPVYGFRNTAMVIWRHGLMPKPKSGNESQLTKEEVDMVFEFLVEKKKQGQFRAVWDNWPQILDLHSSGELWLSDAWQPAVLECQRRGVPIRYAYVWEGFDAWCHVVAIPKKASEEAYQRALTFINWWNDGAPGKHICENGYLIATNNERAKKHLSEAQFKKWYLGQGRDCGPIEIQKRWIAHWDQWPKEIKYYTKRWQQFLAA